MSKAATAATAASNVETSNGTFTSSSGTTFKRADSSGGGEISYVRLNALSAGDVAVEGIFLGSTANITYPEKLDYKFKTADDKTVVVNEGGNLKSRMKDISAGTLLVIRYLGMQKITKGIRAGKMAHNVEVLIAD